ncbi:MAG TPA: helix-turn-helix domain-containing protein [Vicinamibacterales bacterium]|nr:helix-turn-helix domain-containing protein [Vicinamibacterales bacterium]
MKPGAPGLFGKKLKAHREAAGFTQEELATIAGLSAKAVSALERGERRRPHVDTVRVLCAALDLTGASRDAFVASARPAAHNAGIEQPSGIALPAALTVILGRDTELQTLRGWLADPAIRLITLTGPGGSGKTRLALELAHAVAAGGATRVTFVQLADVRNPAFVGSAIAEALGLADVTARDLATRARIACGDQSTLLVLDNFEQVLDAASLVADLLTSVPSLRVLVTSRAPLHVRGEREHTVGPLAIEGPAIELFVERVRQGRPDFRLTLDNRPIIAEICRRLDGLPLALELAAPWLKVVTPEDLLRQLSQDVLLTSVRRRDFPERQQTMNATIAWSYELLAPNERRLFRRLAVLSGNFSIEAATVLGGGQDASHAKHAALEAAASLIDKSLLLRAGTSAASRPRFRMLETVRAYASVELTASGERDDALEGLARFCLTEASPAANGLIGPAQAQWLDRVRDDLENYRGALAWLIERGRAQDASEIAWRLMWFWVIRGHTVEGLGWYGQILNLPSLPSAAVPRVLVASAAMSYVQGDLESARTALTRALALARANGDLEMVAQSEIVLGHVERSAGNFDAARDQFAHCLDYFRSQAIPWAIGNALAGLAAIALATGDTHEAERLVDDATSSLQHAGPWFLHLGLYVRAILAVRRGKPDEAIAVMRESLTYVRELQDKFAFVYALVPLAAAAVLRGDVAWGARILGVRDAISERTGTTVVDKSVHDLRDRAESDVRAHLGRDRWDRAYAAGRVASIDSLIEDIDRTVGKT